METTISSAPGNSLGTGRIVGLIAAAVVILGTFLPWASVLGMNINGTEGDGWITLGIAVVGGVLLLLNKVPVWVPLIAGVLVVGVGGYDLYNMLATDVGADVDAAAAELLGDFGISVGYGLYLTILGGVGMVVGSGMAMMKK